jgi:flagellar hook-associated protein 2
MSSVGFNNLAGGSSGIDVQGMVDQAIAAASGPIRLLQNQKTLIGKQANALQTLNTNLSSLLDTVNSLQDVSGQFNAQSAVSSNTSVLNAAADSTAAAGSHSITITSLATTSSYYTAPVTTSSTPLATGTFNITVGGVTTGITVDSTNNTLDGLASSINGLNIGVSAGVVNDANGSRLTLVSKTTGAPGDIAVTPGAYTGLSFTKAVTGANAALTVDGVPISSTSNTVTGVLAGVTLNLSGTSPTTAVNVTVAPDTSKATDAINQFVSAYNTVVKGINDQFQVNPDGTGAGPLASLGTLRQVQQQLLSAMIFSVSGNGGIVNLSSLGVKMNNDGTLSTDSTAVQSNLAAHFSNAKAFLQGTTSGGVTASGFATNFKSLLKNLTDPTQGPIGLTQAGLTQTTSDITRSISGMTANLAMRRQTLMAQYSQVDAILRALPLLQAQISQQLGTVK